MGYQLRHEPMTLEEIKAKSADCFIEEVIPVPLTTIIDLDYVGLLDWMEEKLVYPHGILTDVEQEVVGSGLDDMVHLKVRGYVDLMDAEE